MSWRTAPGCSDTTVNSRVCGVSSPDGKIGDQHGGSLHVHAKSAAVIAALAVTERGKEVDLFDHARNDCFIVMNIRCDAPPPGRRVTGAR